MAVHGCPQRPVIAGSIVRLRTRLAALGQCEPVPNLYNRDTRWPWTTLVSAT